MAQSASRPGGSPPDTHSRKTVSLGARHERGSKLHALAGEPWPPVVIPLLIGFWSLVLAVLLSLATSAHLAPGFPADVSLTTTIQHDAHGSPFSSVMTFIGDQAGPLGAAIQYVIILGVFLVLRLFREALCTAVSGLGAEVINIVVNGFVLRPRPPGYTGTTVLNLGSHSFPSGHTANGLGLYGFLFFLALLAARAYPKWRGWLIAAQVACVLYVLDIGPSRVIEGQHWPSDVLAGYLVAMLTLTLAITLYHLLAVRDRETQASSGPQPTALESPLESPA